MGRVIVRFLRGHPPYNRGEVAGFPEEEARRILALPGPVALPHLPTPEPVADAPEEPADGAPPAVEAPAETPVEEGAREPAPEPTPKPRGRRRK